MTILHISDTHNHHRQLQDLPAADVLVHSGDFTLAGTENEVTDFMEWFCDLPYKHKVIIAGNFHFGSKILNEAVKRIKTKAHLFGHIHAANGLYQSNGVIFSNAAMVDEDYKLCHSPHLIELSD